MSEEKILHPMSGAMLRCVTEAMGINQEYLARLLECNPRTVRRWIAYEDWQPGENFADPNAIQEIYDMIEDHRSLIREIVEDIENQAKDSGRATVETYIWNEVMAANDPDGEDGYPAMWHRTAVGRALDVITITRPDIEVHVRWADAEADYAKSKKRVNRRG